MIAKSLGNAKLTKEAIGKYSSNHLAMTIISNYANGISIHKIAFTHQNSLILLNHLIGSYVTCSQSRIFRTEAPIKSGAHSTMNNERSMIGLIIYAKKADDDCDHDNVDQLVLRESAQDF
jgi:hypothetical protein